VHAFGVLRHSLLLLLLFLVCSVCSVIRCFIFSFLFVICCDICGFCAVHLVIHVIFVLSKNVLHVYSKKEEKKLSIFKEHLGWFKMSSQATQEKNKKRTLVFFSLEMEKLKV